MAYFVRLIVWLLLAIPLLQGCERQDSTAQNAGPAESRQNHQIKQTAPQAAPDAADANPVAERPDSGSVKEAPNATGGGSVDAREFLGYWVSDAEDDWIAISKSGEYFTVEKTLMGERVKLNGTYSNGAMKFSGPAGEILVTHDRAADKIIFIKEYRRASVPSPTEGLSKSAFAIISLPRSPNEIVDAKGKCDAAELYAQAIADFKQNSKRYDPFLTPVAGLDLGEAMQLKGVQLLLQAKDCAGMTLFSNQPEKVITYEQKPEIEALREVGKVTNNVGLLLKAAGRDAEAVEYHEAVFALGAKLCAERVAYSEFQLGLEMMSTAVGTEKSSGSMMGLAKTAGDEARVAELAAFRSGYLSLDEDRIRPVWRVISSTDPKLSKTHLGDYIAIAQSSQEAMWQVEAILKLGRERLAATSSLDRAFAADALESLAKREKPFIRIAAKRAQSLTLEKYRELK